MMEETRSKPSAIVWPLGASLLVGAVAMAAAAEFEEPPTLHASEVLPADLRQGPHHRLEEAIENDGFLNTYTIDSTFGVFVVRGESLLRVRVEELAALARLAEVTKSEAFARALGEAALQPVEAVGNVLLHPVATAKGLPSGVSRYFKRKSRQIRKTSREIDETLGGGGKGEEEGEDTSTADPGAAASEEGGREGEGGSTTSKMKEATSDATRSFFGVGGAKREWCQKLKVDPYSTNEVLQGELDRVASAASVGGFAVGQVTPGLGAIEYVGELDEMVWMMNPADLEVLNARRLREMGLEKPEVEALLAHRVLSPTRLTGLVSALHAIEGASGLGELARLAGAAETEEEALFFQGSAQLLSRYHREVAPVVAIAPGGVWGGGLTAEGTLVLALALDHLAWTETGAAALREASERYGKLQGVTRLELRLSGSASPRAAEELAALGWELAEGAR